MLGIIIKNTISFIALVLLQVLVLNNVQFSGYINPMLYVLFLLLLPFETSKSFLLILGFIVGLSIDMFTNTMGMHASACVFLCLVRPFILKYIEPRGGYEHEAFPSIREMGLAWYLSYAGILVLMHHLVLFYVEVFRFSELLTTFYRVILSACFSLMLIIICQYLIFGNRK
ncbi:MAG: rod shape-determining protein MreD [Flavobacteriales bacterium]|nr:rod shape-determining protein MreD [Flavobacteriales bacterium]